MGKKGGRSDKGALEAEIFDDEPSVKGTKVDFAAEVKKFLQENPLQQQEKQSKPKKPKSAEQKKPAEKKEADEKPAVEKRAFEKKPFEQKPSSQPFQRNDKPQQQQRFDKPNQSQAFQQRSFQPSQPQQNASKPFYPFKPSGANPPLPPQEEEDHAPQTAALAAPKERLALGEEEEPSGYVAKSSRATGMIAAGAAKGAHVKFGDDEEEDEEAVATEMKEADTEMTEEMKKMEARVASATASSSGASSQWYNVALTVTKSSSEAAAAASTPVVSKLTADQIERFYKLARGAYREAVADHVAKEQQKRDAGSGAVQDEAWLSRVIRTGTMSDKIAALITVIQKSPFYCIQHLDAMLNMVESKNNHESTAASDALRDLMITHLLPNNRSLAFFKDQPLMDARVLQYAISEDAELAKSIPQSTTPFDKQAVRKCLCYWFFEDALKTRLTKFSEVLTTNSRDSLEANRSAAVKNIFWLLVTHPHEGGSPLMANLINKFGDQSNRLASSIALRLKRIATHQPSTRADMVSSIQEFLFRANLDLRSQFYALIALREVPVMADPVLALRVSLLFGSCFKRLIATGEVKSIVLKAIVSGLKLSIAHTPPGKNPTLHELIEDLFRLADKSPLTIAVQCLAVLYLLSQHDRSISDRYYRVLYSKIFSPELRTTNRIAQFFSLLYRSMKNDAVDKRIMAFVKRLLQASHLLRPEYTVGALMVISEVATAHRAVWSNIMTAEDEHDAEEAPPLISFSSAPAEEPKPESSDSSSKPSKKGAMPANNPSSKFATLASYDPLSNDPMVCKANRACVWELITLAHHTHPSVARMAQLLLSGERLAYDGDPLQDLSLSMFLNKFVLKRIKQKQRHGMTPSIFGAPVLPRAIHAPLPGEKKFVDMDEEDVPEDERFFYAYHKRKQEGKLTIANGAAGIGKMDWDKMDDETLDRAMLRDAKFMKMMKSAGVVPVNFHDDEEDKNEAGEYDYDNLDADLFFDDVGAVHLKPVKEIEDSSDEEDDEEEEEPMVDEDALEGILAEDEEFGENEEEDEDEDLDDANDKRSNKERKQAKRLRDLRRRGEMHGVVPESAEADAEDLADLLELGVEDDRDSKEVAWEKSRAISANSNKRDRPSSSFAPRGGRGGAGPSKRPRGSFNGRR